MAVVAAEIGIRIIASLKALFQIVSIRKAGAGEEHIFLSETDFRRVWNETHE